MVTDEREMRERTETQTLNDLADGVLDALIEEAEFTYVDATQYKRAHLAVVGVLENFAAAERDAERERTTKMLEEIAEEHHVAHQDKFKSEWQRDTEWNKYIRYKEAAELVRSRVAAKGEKVDE